MKESNIFISSIAVMGGNECAELHQAQGKFIPDSTVQDLVFATNSS